MQETRKIHPAVTALIVIVLIGIVVTVAIVINNGNGETNTNSNSTQTTETEEADTSTPVENVSQYTDGTYEATGTYSTPGGRESIEVSVTLKDGVVEDITVVGDADSGEAKGYQDQFLSAYKDRVVGKNIEAVSLSRVAGSSLTSNGFNDAIDDIKADAAA